MIDFGRDTTRGIINSRVFLVLLTENWIKTPRCFAELSYAKLYKKPIFVALKDGVSYNPEWFSGVKHLRIVPWDGSEEDISRVMFELKEFADSVVV